MNRYAQLLYGKVLYIFETHLKKEDLPTIFDPSTYWVDVTGQDCEVGYIAAFADGVGIVLSPPPEPEPPSKEEIQRQLTNAVQAFMDETVQTRNYDTIHTACTYANSTDHVFAAEGLACVKWRDSVWRKCYDVLAEVNAGSRAIPTAKELIAELPVLEW